MTKEDYNNECKNASKKMIEDIANILLASNGIDILYNNATISESDNISLHGITMSSLTKELNISFNLADPNNNVILSKIEAAATAYYKKCDDAYREYDRSANK